MPRYYRVLKVIRLIVVATGVLLAVACGSGGPKAGPGQVDAENSAALTSAGLTADVDFEAQFYCRNSDTRIALDRYLIGAHREEGLPPPSSPDYQEALPPICIVSPMGGVPPYTASAAIEGRELRRVTTSTTELTFAVPPLSLGVHTVDFTVTDSKGQRGGGSSEVELYWQDASRISTGFASPASELSEHEPGTPVDFEVEYEAYEPTEQPQLGIESFETQSYSITWTFGDGTIETYEVDPRAGFLRATHVYQDDGLYGATVSIEGDRFGQRGSSSLTIDVRPAGSTRTASGEVVQQWRLVGVITNPAGASLRTNDVSRVFSDDTLNNYVERTVTFGASSLTVGTVKGKGTKQSFIGNYEVAADRAPDVLTVGGQASFSISGSVTNVLGTDAVGETLRLSGLPGQQDQTINISGGQPSGTLEATFDVPSPTAIGDTIVITASVDGCGACVIQWVYRYG